MTTPRRALFDFDGRRLQGARPFAQFEVRAGSWSCRRIASESNKDDLAAFPEDGGEGDALTALSRLLQQARAICGDAGAAIGYFGYDFARQLEPRAFNDGPLISKDETRWLPPDARLTFYETLTTDRGTHWKDSTQISSLRPQVGASAATPTEIPNEYLAAARRIKEYIEAGDIYQANLTWRFERPLTCSPVELYERLCRSHPSRFGACLEWDDFSIVSNSPERFLRLVGRTLTAEPIKGTIRRGATENEDECLRQTLHYSAKDRAENVMIVDLLRNDLGRVCEWGSIHVPALWKIQTLPTLHHLVSTVSGTLRWDLSAVDAFRAAFPCGSITGAPKIRAMQIIDQLEPARRGISMGAAGYFSFGGDMDWNVAIRTVTCQNRTATFHAGGGLVADSVIEAEWQELQLKAGALLSAIGTG